MKTLTKRQKEILDFIRGWIEKKGYSPTFREIMRHFEFSSVGTVVQHLKALSAKGFLQSEEKKRRSLVPLSLPSRMSASQEIELPFVGMVQADFPIEMYPEAKTFPVPTSLVRYPDITYVIQVQGSSLESELMKEGDLLLVEARQLAEAAELILATATPGGQTLIRRYYPEGEFIRLEGSSPKTPSLFLKQGELKLHGVVSGLLRTY
jgi:repressor LexA